MATRHPDLVYLEKQFGIHMPDAMAYIPDEFRSQYSMAMDAQPALVTVSNSGIPSYLLNYIDPKLVEVLTAPMNATNIAPEVKKGSWTSLTATFPVIEHTGQVASYGDWNQNGSTSANPTFPQRQSYHYQTMTEWGERQLDMAAEARIDWAARLNVASALVLNKYQNMSYFLGISGLQNYGLLNDPNLRAALTPGTKVAGGVKWVTNGIVTATANEIYADLQAMYMELATQSKGLITRQTPMIVGLSPQSEMALTATNSFNVSVSDLLRKSFPSLEFQSAPEYSTAAGELVQMYAVSVEGQQVAETAFTEKMRAHTIVKETSAFKQKKSQGTWGSVIYYPWAVSQMLGV